MQIHARQWFLHMLTTPLRRLSVHFWLYGPVLLRLPPIDNMVLSVQVATNHSLMREVCLPVPGDEVISGGCWASLAMFNPV